MNVKSSHVWVFTFFTMLIFLILGQGSKIQARGKIIELGYDMPTAQWLADNFEQADSVPFDGVVLDLGYRGNNGFSESFWSTMDLTSDLISRINADIYHLRKPRRNYESQIFRHGT